jgi:hypothetical protein
MRVHKCEECKCEEPMFWLFIGDTDIVLCLGCLCWWLAHNDSEDVEIVNYAEVKQ